MRGVGDGDRWGGVGADDGGQSTGTGFQNEEGKPGRETQGKCGMATRRIGKTGRVELNRIKEVRSEDRKRKKAAT